MTPGPDVPRGSNAGFRVIPRGGRVPLHSRQGAGRDKLCRHGTARPPSRSVQGARECARMRWLKLTAGSAAIAAVAVVTAVWLGNSELREAQRQIAALEHEKAELIEYAERLVASRRVAQIDVLSQSRDEQGAPLTRIRWQEVDGRGTRGTPLELTARGEQ